MIDPATADHERPAHAEDHPADRCATDGIGRETALRLAPQGHALLLAGRSPEKLTGVAAEVAGLPGAGPVETYTADLSRLPEAAALADVVAQRHSHLDVLINNAGVYRTATPETADGLDARFAVNTIAPYLLTRRLLPVSGQTSPRDQAAAEHDRP